MAWNGRLLVVGFASSLIPQLPVNLPLVKGYSLIGVFWGTFIQAHPQDHADNMQELYAWIENGKVRPVIDTIYPLSDGITGLKRVAGRGAIGKVVMKTVKRLFRFQTDRRNVPGNSLDFRQKISVRVAIRRSTGRPAEPKQAARFRVSAPPWRDSR